jgi:CRP-like cAMP-binding protein
VVGTLQPGEAFGETAFLLQQPRTLDVYAVDGEARILSLSESVLRCILHDRPDLATKLLMNLSKILCARA